MKGLSYIALVFLVAALGYWIGYQQPDRQLVNTTKETEDTLGNTGRPNPAVQQINTELSSYDLETSYFAQQHQLAVLAGQMTDHSRLEELITPYLRNIDRTLHYEFARMLIHRYVDVDPVAAFNFINRFTDNKYYRHLLISTLQAIALTKPELVLDLAKQIENEAIRQNVLATMAINAHIVAFGYAESFERELNDDGRAVMERYLTNRLDPRERFDQLRQLNEPGRYGVLYTAFFQWWTKDPEAAESGLSTLENKELRDRLLWSLVRSRNQRGFDILETFELVRGISPDNTQLESSVLGQMMQSDPNRFLPYAEEFYDRTGNENYFADMLSAWATIDQDAAFAYAAEQGEELLGMVYIDFINDSIRKTPNETFEWALSLDDPRAHHRAASALVNIDQALAQDWLDRLGDSQAGGVLLAELTNKRSNTNLEETIEWLGDYEDYDAYPNIISTLVYSNMFLNKSNAEALGPFLIDQSHDERLHNAFMSYSQIIADDDIGEATDFVADLPDNENRSAGEIGLMMGAASEDPALSIRIFNELGDHQQRTYWFNLAHMMLNDHPERLGMILASMELSQPQIDQLQSDFD